MKQWILHPYLQNRTIFTQYSKQIIVGSLPVHKNGQKMTMPQKSWFGIQFRQSCNFKHFKNKCWTTLFFAF